MERIGIVFFVFTILGIKALNQRDKDRQIKLLKRKKKIIFTEGLLCADICAGPCVTELEN